MSTRSERPDRASVPPADARDALGRATPVTRGEPGAPRVSLPPAPKKPAPPTAAARRGRRLTLTVVYVFGAGLALATTAQVASQIFARSGPPGDVATCHDGLRALATSTETARKAASGIEGEDAALARFRSTLAGAWAKRDEVALRCKGEPRDERALDAIERLRYAEEHAVRLEAGELAPLRRRVQAIVEQDLGGARDARDDGPREPPPAP